MGRRNQQHMGRNDDLRQELVGRDVRGDDETADRANVNAVPMPNEEGTGKQADDAADDGERRDGGSGSREVAG